MKTKKFLATIWFASMPGHRWERGKSGSRKFQAPQHAQEALDLAAKSLSVTSTFMTLSPGGRMNPGRDHEAEKSVPLTNDRRPVMKFQLVASMRIMP
jgi:hypothetical protein